MELNPYPSEDRRELLRKLPGVDKILEFAKKDPALSEIPKAVVTRAIRAVLGDLREGILNNGGRVPESRMTGQAILDQVRVRADAAMRPNLRPVINATGVIVHTNLGRSLLPQAAIENVVRIASGYANLEFNLDTGKRGSRYSAVEGLICELTGAEAAMIVNNNAGAVLLSLDTLAHGRPVIVSRGELVEIGGSFRVPDVMAKSGALLREVGTTNRTHLHDYENAIEPETAQRASQKASLMLKVHTSNYSVVGFTKAVPLAELVELGRRRGVPVMEDLGSGTFFDFSAYGLTKEPTVQESVAAGADLITFSGDKLLGGPQAGIILGTAELIGRIRKNPITRALRIDKMTLAALESLLRIYREPETALQTIPTLRMITCPLRTIAEKAVRFAGMLADLEPKGISVELIDSVSRVGGGALPIQDLPTKCLGIAVDGLSANQLERRLRGASPPVIGRIEDDRLMLDFRTVREDEFDTLRSAFRHVLERGRP